jgi:hypothetical protein
VIAAEAGRIDRLDQTQAGIVQRPERLVAAIHVVEDAEELLAHGADSILQSLVCLRRRTPPEEVLCGASVAPTAIR